MFNNFVPNFIALDVGHRMVVSAYGFTASIAINTHLSYTDGAYANVANVAADLAYLGITTIRDAVPNPAGGIPAANQIAAFGTLAADGIKFDLLISPNLSIAQTIQQIEMVAQDDPGSIIAIEGPNEINNNPVSYAGLSGQAAANAYQAALYQAVKANAVTAGIMVYDYTGGIASPVTVAGSITQNFDGSYTLANGQTGFPVTLPAGLSTISLTYSGQGTAGSGLFSYPGQGQVSPIYNGANGSISYSYDNNSGAAQPLYVDFIDWGSTLTLTDISVTGPGSTANLVTFDPDLSLAGLADDANIHAYPNGNSPIGPVITSNFQTAFGNAAPGPRVITETGYTTDLNVTNGVSQAVQAQQIIDGLFEAYQSGVATTYLYELLDEKPDASDTNSQMHYGLFNADNTPKPAAVAVHNLTSLLSDTGADAASFQPGSLNDTETGATASDHLMILEKSSGVFDIALWNDADAGTTNADPIAISLGQTYQNVTVYDVVTDAAQSYSNVSEVDVALGGDAMIVEIDPNPVVSIHGFLAGITASILSQVKSMGFLAPAGASTVSSDARAVTVADMAGTSTSEAFGLAGWRGVESIMAASAGAASARPPIQHGAEYMAYLVSLGRLLYV